MGDRVSQGRASGLSLPLTATSPLPTPRRPATRRKFSTAYTETLTVKTTLAVPQYVHGISIDFYGYVWGVSMGSQAYRVNPMDASLLTFEGLVGAYSYSDMTGFALSNVGNPQG